MSKTTGGLFATIIGGIIVTFIVSFFTSDSPELFLEKGCDQFVYETSPSILFQIRNRGDVDGYGSVCIRSNGVLFEDLNNSSDYCISDSKFSKKSTELLREFKSDLKFLHQKSPNNITITITSDCKSKVWGFVSKQCGGIQTTCRYKLDSPYYQLLK